MSLRKSNYLYIREWSYARNIARSLVLSKRNNNTTFSFSSDFLYIYDGNVTDPALLLSTETGIIVPSDAHSTSQDMIVVFNSDFSFGKTGFKASISYIQTGQYDDLKSYGHNIGYLVLLIISSPKLKYYNNPR